MRALFGGESPRPSDDEEDDEEDEEEYRRLRRRRLLLRLLRFSFFRFRFASLRRDDRPSSDEEENDSESLLRRPPPRDVDLVCLSSSFLMLLIRPTFALALRLLLRRGVDDGGTRAVASEGRPSKIRLVLLGLLYMF